jgi:NADH-quinone oxidoreductase subunit B
MEPATLERVRLTVAGRPVVMHVAELGLACCGIEVRAARRAAQVTGRLVVDVGSPGGDGSAALHVLVVAGTVTARLGPALMAAWERLPHPRAVLAFGACTASGGPYWDSYAVVPGAQELVPVDVWVPGCPPRPADLIDGLEEVLRVRG